MKKYILTTLTLVFLNLIPINLKADFIAVTNKQVNLNKSKEVTARTEEENNIFKGYAQVETAINLKTQKDVYKIFIIWTSMTSKNGKLSLEGLTSNIELEKPILPSGTALLIKGNITNNYLSSKKDEKDKERKTPANTSNYGTSPTTNISTPMQSPVGNPSNANLFQPKIIVTYEGCNHLYNIKKEIITAFQQSYYLDKNGKKVQVQACQPSRDYPAKHQPCTNLDDFTEHITYLRHQAYFTVTDPASKNQEAYAAGGCISYKRYPHMLDYSVCPAIPMGDKFVKQAKWYYQTETGDKVYVTNCIIDPENKTDELKVQFEGCPVTHDIDHNQSIHTGKYYYIKSSNEKEYLSGCITTKQSSFKHQLEWKEEWEHNNEEKFSQRILIRYIYIPTEKRKIIVQENELDPTRYSHFQKLDSWQHFDSYEQGGKNGKSIKIMKSYVKFGDTDYYTGGIFQGAALPHICVSTDFIRREKCGPWYQNKKRRYYIDNIKRPDNTIYKTHEYNTGCH